MARLCAQALALAQLAALAGCGPNYSPDTYASSAVQQANKVEQGVIIGVRSVAVSAAGTVGAATGAAAGGILGAQAGPGGITNALGAVGGALAGGLVGTTVEHAEGDTKAWEYIVKETKGDLVSVTQKDDKPLAVGQKVLVIAGSQARVVPDYTVAPSPSPASTSPPEPGTALPPPAPVTEGPLAPPPGSTASPPGTPPTSVPPASTPATVVPTAPAPATPPLIP